MTNEYEPLHIKYRPQTLDDFVGNGVMVNSLKDTLAKKGKPHSYLFHGPSGCGKTTLARILAKMTGCSERDFHEMNSANYRGIDSVRDLMSKAGLRPWKGDVVVYLLDEVHCLTTPAQNALLKLLEEPPAHCYFALCTTEPDKLLATIKTRCAQFAVSSLGRRALTSRLDYVAEKETGQEPPAELIREIARASGGSMRSALMILDQVIDIEDLDDAIEAIEEATGTDRQVIELCRTLIKKPTWKTITPILEGIRIEPESARQAVLGYFNTVALKNPDPWVAMLIIEHFSTSVMYSGRAGLALACWRITEEIREG